MRATSLLLLLAAGCGTAPRAASPDPRPPGDGSAAASPVDPACDGARGLVASPRGPIAARWDHHVTMGGEGTLDVAWCGDGSVSVHQVMVGTRDAGRWVREYDPGTQVASRGRPLALTVPGRPTAGSTPVTVIAVDGDGHQREATATITSVDDPARTAERAACVACGGDWGPVGMLGTETCDCPTHDAGKPCRSHDDCESVCIADGFEPVPAAELPATFTCPAHQRAERLIGRCHDRQHAFGCRPLLSYPGPRCEWIDGAAHVLPTTCTD